MPKTTKEIMYYYTPYSRDEIKEIEEVYEMQKDFKDLWFSEFEVDELKKKLKERIDALSFSIKGTRYTDLAYVDGIHLAITNVFDEVTKK